MWMSEDNFEEFFFFHCGVQEVGLGGKPSSTVLSVFCFAVFVILGSNQGLQDAEEVLCL